MARRKPSDEVDSLELLLDTICNMFGGVIFIAILVTLLTSAQAVVVREAASPNSQSDIATAALLAQIEEYQEGIDQLRRTSSVADGETLRQGRRIKDALTDGQRDSESRVKAAERWLEDYEQIIRNPTARVDDRLRNVRERLVSIEVQLKEADKASTIEARLPVERTTDRRQVMFLLSNNRIHWIPIGRGQGVLPAEFADDVRIETGVTQWIVRPRPEGGTATNGDLEQSARIKAILGSMRADRDFFHLFVQSDSVVAFQQFKAVILKHGFRYNVTAFPASTPLILAPTDKASVQ